MAIRHENYPPPAVTGLLPLPGHTVIVLPPVSIVNLLPVEFQYYFPYTDICGSVKPGKEAQLPAVCTHLYYCVKKASLFSFDCQQAAEKKAFPYFFCYHIEISYASLLQCSY